MSIGLDTDFQACFLLDRCFIPWFLLPLWIVRWCAGCVLLVILLACSAGISTGMSVGIGGWDAVMSGTRKAREGYSVESTEGMEGEEGRLHLLFCCSAKEELEELSQLVDNLKYLTLQSENFFDIFQRKILSQ